MLNLIGFALLLIHLWVTVLVGYLLLLTAAAFRSGARTPLPNTGPACRFVVLIPAHNEEKLLPGLLTNLSLQNYPARLWQAHVVADNCSDQTAAVALQGGAQVHVRHAPNHPGKGPALEWLFKRVRAAGTPVDAVLVLDADSVISPDFLRIMAARVERGERVIQAYYAVREPGASWSSSLRYAALAVLHYLRPLGRMALGASAGLKGNGMVFAPEVLQAHPWSASVTEDIELHMNLILAGERVTFAPDAVVLGEMPDSLKNSKSQHLRWERGKQEMGRRYVPQLLKHAFQAAAGRQFGRSGLLLDAVLEYWIPPFSVLLGVSVLLVACDLGLLAVARAGGDGFVGPNARSLALAGALLGVFILLGQAIYLLAGLRLVRAPRSIYLSLLYAPFYIIWKFVQVLHATFSTGPQEWVRTKRNER